MMETLSGFPFRSQDGKQKDAECICLFRIGNIRWYILEGQKEGEDFTLYGIVVGLCETEYGYISANELQDIKVRINSYATGTLTVKQDRSFKACRIGDIRDSELQDFLSSIYGRD